MLPSGLSIGHRPTFQVTKSGVVHRKKCRHPKTPADLSRRFCLVCGCKAENYNFGVVSCESCKAFFRRNAHKKFLEAGAGFACSYRRGGCDVTVATRKKCPGCRLAKCFAVGMQADLIQRLDAVDYFSEAGTSSHGVLAPSSSANSASAAFSSLVQQQQQRHQHGQHLMKLWQHLQTPSTSSCQPSSFTDASCNSCPAASEHPRANTLLVDFFCELRRLVRDTMLCDIAPTTSRGVGGGGRGGGGQAGTSGVQLLEAFVQQTAKFVGGLRPIDRLDREHFVTLLRRRLHSVLFPLSCAGFSHLDGGFYFTVGGQLVKCQPIELFCDMVRQASNRLVDYTLLADWQGYTRRLLELTDMRLELLALFCGAKLFCLPPLCDCGRDCEDPRLIGACRRLADRYHEHLVDSLYYHYPFDFDAKLSACCELFRWSADFDRTLESFFHYCPLQSGGSGTCE